MKSNWYIPGTNLNSFKKLHLLLASDNKTDLKKSIFLGSYFNKKFSKGTFITDLTYSSKLGLIQLVLVSQEA